jgi:hypothetical protein
MKTSALILAAFLLCHAALADLVVVQQIESPMQNGTMTVRMKDDKTRVDVSPAMSVIADTATGDTLSLMHPQKSYMKISGATMKAMQEKAVEMNANQEPPKLVPTGRKETINGHATEEYTSTVGNMKVAYWIAKDYPQFRQLLAQMLKMQQNGPGQAMRNAMPRPEDFPGMPVRTVIDMGGQSMKTTVVSVKEEKLDASLFAVPAGYTEMAMPAMPPGGGGQ